MKRAIGKPKIKLVDVVNKDMLIKEVIESHDFL